MILHPPGGHGNTILEIQLISLSFFPAKRYDTDLTLRKTSVKNMIQDELTRLVDEADEEDKDEQENTEDEKQPSVQGVEA